MYVDWTKDNDHLIRMEIKPDTKFILVIEKQGIFHRLCEDKFANRMKCIMITGCGIPDVATRALLSKISNRSIYQSNFLLN
jgi:meiotic recombination protein SPO11